ncbi:MAG: metallophosphoesterase family protein [Acidimicrobiales bacterium]
MHTSDWQLGMTRAFMPAESRARYADDQIEAVRAIARVAAERECAFVVVAGDVFDSITPDRRVLNRAFDALMSFTVPVYLLPGNHDAYSPASFWWSVGMIDRMPAQVTVLRDTSLVRVPGVDAEVIGAPWPSRHPDSDLVSAALEKLDPIDSRGVRVAVGHGGVDSLAPDRLDPDLISASRLERALGEHLASYVALGDRHSVTKISDAVWYSGAPIATDYREVDANKALIVEVGSSGVVVEPVQIGGWRFLVETFDVTGQDSLSVVEAFLAGITDKERAVVKLGFVGTVSLSTNAKLEELLERYRDLLAALELSERRSDLVVVADDDDLSSLDLSGFAQSALSHLAEIAAGKSDEADVATDALMLLRRLATGRSR